MNVLQLLNPIASSLTLFVTALQLAAFLRTIVLATQMQQLFGVTGLAVTVAADNGSSISLGASPQQRLSLNQSAPQGTSAAELVALTNLAVKAASTLQTQLRNLRDAVLGVVARYEERVTTLANVPVYLGLVGTFAGVMSGVLQIILSGGMSESSIKDLLAGVFVAMFSSLLGVTLMIAANAVVLPRARNIRDQQMAHYFSTLESAIVQATTSTPQPARSTQDDVLDHIEMLASSLDAFSHSIGQQRALIADLQRLDFSRTIQTNIDFAKQLPALVTLLTDFQANVSRLMSSTTASIERAIALSHNDIASAPIGRYLSTLPQILEVLRELSTGTQPRSQSRDLLPMHVSSRHARLVAFVVFGIAAACLQVGLLTFSGSHLGAGLVFGGAVLAYEAVYVFIRSEDPGTHE